MPTQNKLPLIDHDLRGSSSKNRLVGFWKMMKGYRMLYLAATVVLGFAALLNTVKFLLIRYFIDDVLPNRTDQLVQVLLLVALGFIGLALLEGVFSFLSGSLAARTSEGLARRIKNFMFDHIQRLTFTYHDKTPTGDLIQRCTSDIDAIRRFFADQAIGIGRILLLFGINFVAILSLHWQLGLLSVVVIPVIVIMSFYFFRRVEKAYDAFQQQDAVLSTALQENLTGVRVVKAFARQEFEIEKFEKENIKKYELGRQFLMMHASFWPLTDIITGVQLLGGYFVAAQLVINGDITIGTYLAYSSMIIWIIFPIRNLGRLIVQMSTGLVSFDRVMEVIDTEREPLGKDDPSPVKELSGHLVFENVGFEYDKDSPVLKSINFEVRPGQTIALLGSTGSGKTSMMGLLPRFYDYTSGSIKLDGVELREFPRYFLRSHIGIVEQEPFLFSRSIRENILYSVEREASEEEVIAAAKAAAIHDSIMTFPEGYNTLVGERGVTLSGGQKQRVALARTLLKNPRILILDDATSSVDTETESQIREALNNMMEGRTSFIIAHRIQSVMLADLILVMDKGEIVQRGTHDELMRDEDGIYRRIYEVQARIEHELEREIASVGI